MDPDWCEYADPAKNVYYHNEDHVDTPRLERSPSAASHATLPFAFIQDANLPS
jgi:hypothetical protein